MSGAVLNGSIVHTMDVPAIVREIVGRDVAVTVYEEPIKHAFHILGDFSPSETLRIKDNLRRRIPVHVVLEVACLKPELLGPRIAPTGPRPGVPVEIANEVAEADLAEDIFSIRPLVRAVVGPLSRIRLHYDSKNLGAGAGLSRTVTEVSVVTDANPSVSDRLQRELAQRKERMVSIGVYFVEERLFAAACALARLAGAPALMEYHGLTRGFTLSIDR